MRAILIASTFGVVFAGAIALFRDVGTALMAAAFVASAGALQGAQAR
ncbi:MAG: hypothetical protein K2Q06_10820 [Parvularculaceae bacterium]|nr:hypothetical protein [Parvularculaceae bacterium]